ncbi:uncharacterized protein LOC124920672 [Impatiens glandulifera]|uniref:uncharacterized protein LOC124920672 n=1 Tax=Impatiens glandulifera TaxID=253017 RepID=UPI001FB113DE|nr:uncharacterized protein LOC124920672 [Impatiens glandulifera]
MELSKPGDISAAPSSILIKRKRGRPRKDRSQIRARTGVRTGLQGRNNIQSHPKESSEVANDSIVGLTVTGVVEAAFDAGYMLKVRIGDSDISLRGVVFKPGHYVPISTENDVAPNVQMIQRTEIPLQKVRKVRRSKGSRRKKDGDYNGNNMSSFLNEDFEQSNKHVPGKSITTVVTYSAPPVGSRGTFVPVVLKPMNLTNGVSPSQQIPIVASPLKTSNSSSQPMQEETEDMNEPLFVEPLQTIHSGFNNQTAPISRPTEKREMGRMSELLEVLNEKLTE